MNPSSTELADNVVQMISHAGTDWGSLHPFMVHFPIVLLLIAPLFVLAACIWFYRWRSLLGLALATMLLGAITMFLAVSTGNIAAEPLEIGKEVVATLNDHVVLAERAQRNFAALTAALLLYFALRIFRFKDRGRLLQTVTLLLYLLVYAWNIVILLNAAHYGGKLVHDHGIHSSFYKTNATVK
jgi:uncharacterized membrane protein